MTTNRSPACRRAAALLLLLGGQVAPALAGEALFDPLALSGAPDSAPPAGERFGLTLEAWRQSSLRRAAALSPGRPAPAGEWRAAVDLRREWPLAAQWRASLSDRLERSSDESYPGGERWRNALREAFVSWRGELAGPAGEADAARSLFVDLGRINQRLGVASGYNPTDVFRSGAQLASLSQNPAELRQNRLGTVAWRAQWLSAGQATTLAWVPRLSTRDAQDTRPGALGLERTNRYETALLRWAPALGERVSLDLPVVLRQGEGLRRGLNATALLGDALVGTLELDAARRAALPTVAAALAGAPPVGRFALRAALGATWTSAQGWSLTLERHRADDALARRDWADWRQAMQAPDGGPARAAYGRLAGDLAYRQDLLVRDQYFARLAWDDAFGQRGVNLSAFVRRNAFDGSFGWQTEAAWNDRRDWSLRLLLGGNRGGASTASTEFGARAQRAFGAVSLSLFL